MEALKVRTVRVVTAHPHVEDIPTYGPPFGSNDRLPRLAKRRSNPPLDSAATFMNRVPVGVDRSQQSRLGTYSLLWIIKFDI